MRKTLPETGRDWDHLETAMDALAQNDIDWRRGRAPLFTFYANDEIYAVARKAFMKFFSENALGGKRAFFSLKQMEQDIIDMALSLFQAPPEACGNMTPGGSESIFLAVKACRDWTRTKRADINQANMVVPYSVHPAFNKAGDALGIEVRRVPVAADLRADVAAMAAAIDDQTIMLVGSAPCFPFGLIDPIPALSQLAEERQLWLHVDACVGGYTAPFAKKLGYPLPDFDFSVPGVCSISADLHKFGFCPKPASTVFCRKPEFYQAQLFDFADWPNGRFVTPTLSGTRPGGAVAAAWAVMQYLGEAGYMDLAEQLIRMTRAYAEGINQIDSLQVLAEPELSILAFGAEQLDIFAVAERMQERGWLPGLLQQPRGMHLMMSLVHEPVREEYLEHLTAAVAEVGAGVSGENQISAVY